MSLKDMIILGIDPGTTIMGFGLIRVNNQAMELIQLHQFQLKKYNDHYLKLEKIFNQMCKGYFKLSQVPMLL